MCQLQTAVNKDMLLTLTGDDRQSTVTCEPADPAAIGRDIRWVCAIITWVLRAGLQPACPWQFLLESTVAVPQRQGAFTSHGLGWVFSGIGWGFYHQGLGLLSVVFTSSCQLLPISICHLLY